MFNRKELKKQAKGKIRNRYWRNILIALVCGLTGAGVLNDMFIGLLSNNTASAGLSNWEYLLNIIHFYAPDFLQGGDILSLLSQGLLAFVVNIVTETQSIVFYVVSSVFGGNFSSALSISFVLLGYLLFVILRFGILNPFRIGARRYFVGKAAGYDSGIDNLIYAFRNFHQNVVLTKLLAFLYQELWMLTIVGGPIKYYAYSMVDYILAENPSMSPKDVIRLSCRMTKGRKWQLFIKDLSFFGYWLLSIVSFGLSDYLFAYSYRELTDAGIYLVCKEEFLAANPEVKLFEQIVERNKYGIILRRNVDYNIRYTLSDYVLLFFAASMIGWIWEVSLHIMQEFEFVNRGTMYGPWLPIYGTGGVVVLAALQKTRNRPVLTFFLSIVLCLSIEYFTGWFLETTRGVKYWDYSDMPFNLDGRICLYGGLAFGIGCIAMIYYIAPAFYQLIHRAGTKPRRILSVVLLGLFALDFVISTLYPNQGEGITTPAAQVLAMFGYFV